MSQESNIDPADSDAPLLHLLSIQHNPAIKDMTQEQLFKKIQELRAVAQSPPTLAAKLLTESTKRRTAIKDPEKARKQKLLDDL